MITLTQLENHVVHALPGEPASQLTKAGLVNEAGEYLFNMHLWKFAERPPVDLQFVAGEQQVQLPVDFGSHIRLVSNNAQVTLASTSILADHQLPAAPTAGFGYWGAYTFTAAEDTLTGHRAMVLTLVPTPTSDVADAVRLWYRAGWITLDAAADIANVPRYAESLLVSLVRAFAVGYEENRLEELLQVVEGGAISRRTKQHDGSVQGGMGPITGGAWGTSQFTQNRFVLEAARAPA